MYPSDLEPRIDGGHVLETKLCSAYLKGALGVQLSVRV